MPRLIAFLRAINVGGRTARMEQLRRLFESLGFSKVETFIASGNVIFRSRSTKMSALENKIAAALEKALGYEVATFVRTEAELDAIARYRPFPQSVLDKATALNIGFVARTIDASATAKLMDLTTDIDDFATRGREVYWLCRRRQSDSTFSNAVFEQALGMKSTFRGANTIQRMAETLRRKARDPRRGACGLLNAARAGGTKTPIT